MKRYFALVFLLAAIVAGVKCCQKEAPRTGDRIINIPTTGVTETYTTQEEAQTYWMPTGSHVGFHENAVDETIYRNLKRALASFESIRANGSVSQQMRNNGTYLNDGDAGFIDDYMGYMYGLVCDYVYSYEAGNYQKCAEALGAMCDADWDGINKSYLFDIQVASKLPAEYNDGTAHVDYSKNIYDSNGYIVMTNGRKLHNVGPADAILSNTPEVGDSYRVSSWYSAVPNIITDQYTVVQNTNGNDGVCHIWNQSNVERCCRAEWENIKRVAQSMYGCDPRTTSIRWEQSANCYIFVGNNGEVYGPADYDLNCRINAVYAVQDAVVNGCGDTGLLDTFIQNMVNVEAVRQSQK